MYVLLLLIFSLNCSDDDPIQYELTTEANPAEGGSVSPVSATYNEGAEVEITATANEEYVFKSWSGDASGNENPIKVVVTDDMVITAEFEKVQYTLEISIIGEGTVEQRVIQAKNTTNYDSGLSIELSAVPQEGWYFTGWSGDHEGSENPLRVEMNQAMSLTATFETKPELNFSFDITGEGKVTWEFITDPFTGQLSVKLSAAANQGWYFVHWYGIRGGHDFFGDYLHTINPLEFNPDDLFTYDPDEEIEVRVVFMQDDGSTTYIPDDRFEQALINVGFDDILDDYVSNKAISRIEALDISGQRINDLTGIEGFFSLQSLEVQNNELGKVIFDPNPFLNRLNLSDNELIELDLSNLVYIIDLDLRNNPLDCVKMNQGQLDLRGSGLVFWKHDDNLSFSLDCGN